MLKSEVTGFALGYRFRLMCHAVIVAVCGTVSPLRGRVFSVGMWLCVGFWNRSENHMRKIENPPNIER